MSVARQTCLVSQDIWSERSYLPLHHLVRYLPLCRVSHWFVSELRKLEYKSGNGWRNTFLFSNWIFWIRWVSTLPSVSSGLYGLLCSTWGFSLFSWSSFMFPPSTFLFNYIPLFHNSKSDNLKIDDTIMASVISNPSSSSIMWGNTAIKELKHNAFP